MHTLAALLPAKLQPNEPSERDLADLKKQIRVLLRAVDAHPKIVSMGNLAGSGLAWSVC
jgi:hypothetical protein